MNFNTCIDSCNYYYNQDTEAFHDSKISFCCAPSHGEGCFPPFSPIPPASVFKDFAERTESHVTTQCSVGSARTENFSSVVRVAGLPGGRFSSVLRPGTARRTRRTRRRFNAQLCSAVGPSPTGPEIARTSLAQFPLWSSRGPFKFSSVIKVFVFLIKIIKVIRRSRVSPRVHKSFMGPAFLSFLLSVMFPGLPFLVIWARNY
jgi:hypothetical protein